MKKIYLISICLFIFLKLAVAQETKKLISVDFQKASIEQVVSDIESKTSYHFYYEPSQFDSLKVTLQATSKPVETILDMAFSNTKFKYSIINQTIFLTKGRVVNVSLPPGFFNTTPNEAAATASTTTTEVTDYTDEKEKVVPEATTENKIYEIGIRTNTIKPGNATLAGYLRDAKSAEPVVGASIYNAAAKIGVATDQFGYYSITLPRGRQTLSIKG